MKLEQRLEKLEKVNPDAMNSLHVVLVPDCTPGDDFQNEARCRKALEANPAPEGVRVMFVKFVAWDPPGQQP